VDACDAFADCPHAKPHSVKDNCAKVCERTGCAPRAICTLAAPTILPPNTAVAHIPASYAARWARLQGELANFHAANVRAIDPVLVLRFMDYIEQAAEAAQ
jgi:hypothetical protein